MMKTHRWTINLSHEDTGERTWLCQFDNNFEVRNDGERWDDQWVCWNIAPTVCWRAVVLRWTGIGVMGLCAVKQVMCVKWQGWAGLFLSTILLGSIVCADINPLGRERAQEGITVWSNSEQIATYYPKSIDAQQIFNIYRSSLSPVSTT